MADVSVVAVIVACTFLAALAAFFFKKGSSSASLREMLRTRALYCGAALYVAAAILNIIALKYMDYSVVLPLTSVTYIWTMLLSRRYLKERITLRKAAGVAAVIAGCAVLVL
jgi:drug/metabolite transporter (DMT)-like permease